MPRAHRSPRGLLATAALTIGLSAALGCSSSPDVMVLDLAYRPTNQPDQGKLVGAVPIAASSQVWVNPVVDLHPEGSRIGVSQEEDNNAVYFGPNGLPPADFMRAALVQALPPLGVPLSNDPNIATHVLEVRMSRFWAVEGNLYQTWISATVLLADKYGNTLWQSEVTGFGKRWGRTFNAEPYIHAFSDAALDFSHNLALNPAFRRAAATIPAPPAYTEPAAPAEG